MKKFLLSLLMLLPACTAFGADMPVKAAPYRAPVVACHWCGFYLGVHVGYGWSRDAFETTPLLATLEFGELKAAGLIFGGQAGHLWQWGAFVAGLEVDATWWNAKKANSLLVEDKVVVVANSLKLDYTASVRAILGIDISNAFLVYVTGGPAFAHADGTLVIDTVTLNAPANHFGYRAGGGIKTKFTENIIFGVEALWSDYGKSTYAFGAGVDVPARLQSGEIRARFDIKL